MCRWRKRSLRIAGEYLPRYKKCCSQDIRIRACKRKWITISCSKLTVKYMEFLLPMCFLLIFLETPRKTQEFIYSTLILFPYKIFSLTSRNKRTKEAFENAKAKEMRYT